jgi:hypothetical protein
LNSGDYHDLLRGAFHSTGGAKILGYGYAQWTLTGRIIVGKQTASSVSHSPRGNLRPKLEGKGIDGGSRNAKGTDARYLAARRRWQPLRKLG